MSTNCLNCNNVLAENHSYCPNCGQIASTHRLDMHHIGHSIVHAFAHADKSILRLIWLLVTQPGKVAAAYVAGKRASYFNPFSFLFVLAGIATLIQASSGFMQQGMINKNPISNFISQHMNVVVLGAVPLLAFYAWLLFKKRGYNYAEAITVSAYISGERLVFFCLLILPLYWVLGKQSYGWLLTAYLIVWFIYTSIAFSQFFYGRVTVPGFFKGLLAALLTQFTTMLIIGGIFWIYYYIKYR